MHGFVVGLIVVVVIIIIYLVMVGGPDKLFISSVDDAALACSAAVASQKDTDFATAIAKISAAKTARSASLNQYAPALAAGPTIPADVAAASKKLDGLLCGNHSTDIAAVQAVTTAKAAADAYTKTPSLDNYNTATSAYKNAKSALDAALALYPAGSTYVTPSLTAAVDTMKSIQVSAQQTYTISQGENSWSAATGSCPSGNLKLTSFRYGNVGAGCSGLSDATNLAMLQSKYVNGGKFAMTVPFNSALGDPCYGIYKQFDATYTCN